MSFPIVFATDENYLVPTYVAIKSLLLNLNKDVDVGIYIFCPYIEESKKQIFYNLSNKIQFINVELNNLFLDKTLNYISLATYYRFLAPSILKDYDVCLYLDSDIIVKEDISDLINMDMEDNLLMGVRNYILKEKEPEFYKNRCQECSIKSLNSYVNAGVLLMNLKEMRKNDLWMEMIEDARTHTYPYNDQDILNKFCFGKIKLLSAKYNFMIQYTKNQEILSKVLKDDISNIKPSIVHYSTRNKPWKYKGSIWANLWWKYYHLSASDIREDMVKSFFSSNKLNLKENIKDFGKYVIRGYWKEGVWIRLNT